ncbi:MAG: hypothetical protein ACP5I6_06420 [Caldisphaera sp.]
MLKEPLSLSELLSRLLSKFKSEEESIGVSLLAENTIRGFLSCLRSQNLVEILHDKEIKWKIKG